MTSNPSFRVAWKLVLDATLPASHQVGGFLATQWLLPQAPGEVAEINGTGFGAPVLRLNVQPSEELKDGPLGLYP
jgi:hypothetical protein